MSRTWQDNATEFALLDQGEGWPFARLVACSVVKGTTAHRPHVSIETRGKVSAREFAERAATSPARVLRYLEAWDKAAERGLCLSSDEMEPDDAMTAVEPDIEWGQIYDASKAGGRPRDSRPEDAVTIVSRRGAEAVVAAMTPEVQQQMAEALIQANPQPAAEALVSSDEGLDAVFEANSKQPRSVEDRLRTTRAHKAREAAETEEVYHLRGFKALPVLWEAENLAEFIETKVARDEEDLDYARTAGMWLQSIGRRIVAWAEGETLPMSDEDFASEIEAVLEAGS